MEPLSERERSIRVGIHKRRAERWRHISDLIQSHSEGVWLDFWREHWPPDKRDMGYALGKDTPYLRRHVRVELRYLRMPAERQEQLEAIIWG